MDPVIWNDAAILYQLWRIIQPTSLWVNWFLKCLLKDKPFWIAKIPSKCPQGARQILNARNQALPHLKYHVGRDSHFYIWHDPLIPNCPLVVRFEPSLALDEEIEDQSRAGQVMNDNEWISFGSNNVNAIEACHLLSSIHIYNRDYISCHDMRFKWVKCSSIYHSIRSRVNPPDWVDIIWHSYSIPRCSLTLWLMLKNRLLTKDRMLRFCLNVEDENCVLCHCLPAYQKLLSTSLWTVRIPECFCIVSRGP